MRVFGIGIVFGFVAIAACNRADPDGGDGDDDGGDDGGDDEPLYPVPDWTTGAPEEHGLDPVKLDDAAAVAELHESYCLLVIRRGVLVYERYFLGATASTHNKSWSVAKTYSSSVVGIAVDRGDLALDDRVVDYIPEWAGSPRDAITIDNLVTMTSGLEWSLWRDYVQMAFLAEDHSASARELEADAAPDAEWTYNNGAVQLLEPVFRAATGGTIDAYAERHLWSRLGMTATWAHDDAGNPTTYANVMASCRDHARFGYLYLRGGVWADDDVVLSADWVARATEPSQDMNRAYGYLVWLNGHEPRMSPMNDTAEGPLTTVAPPDLIAARGFGSQFIDVIPSLDMVIVRFGKDPLADAVGDPSEIIDAVTSDSNSSTHDEIVAPIVQSVVD